MLRRTFHRSLPAAILIFSSVSPLRQLARSDQLRQRPKLRGAHRHHLPGLRARHVVHRDAGAALRYADAERVMVVLLIVA